MKIIIFLLLLSEFQLESFDVFGTEQEINAFLKSGNQFGYFTYEEFLEWFRLVRNDEENIRYLSDFQ